jgi:TPP-dependent pyruvate/acetoin dehydrogenase alpha subunit
MKDPIERLERHLAGEAGIDRSELERIVADLNRELDEEVEFARSSPFPPADRAPRHLYAEDPWERRS